MNTWDINILVNGNRCKQYQHQGRTYIEAKQGSEYAIEIKNNYWKRILAVSSVDGLNVLTGKTATQNDTGYIIDAYHAEKIKGFRFSDDEWAMFRFGYKFNGQTYAQSKGDGAEKNCGVIGLRLFYEKDPIIIYNSTPIPVNPYPETPWTPWQPTWTTCHVSGGLSSVQNCSYTANINYAETEPSVNWMAAAMDSTYDEPFTKCSSGHLRSRHIPKQVLSKKLSFAENSRGFDMGTEWGRKEHSKVNTVTFEKGCLAHSLDIYYDSRESLIEMGVPLFNNLKSNAPQSFPDKYAQPPANWRG